MSLFLTVILLLCLQWVCAQQHTGPRTGKLFIIGGGNRSPELILDMVKTARLSSGDHIAILPMSSQEPDSGCYYIKIQLEKACSNTIANLNFTAANINNIIWLDSLRSAKLIFITGGDQQRFMKIVLHSPVYKAIHDAYARGATVAGSSAGAAVMSRLMITGNEKDSSDGYHETFRKLRANNIIMEEGLGLLDSAIIDQHFVVRSRYNRLLSALAAFPAYPCIGIDEATAIIVERKKVLVTGAGQVVVLSNPKQLQIVNGLIKMRDLQFAVYTKGDTFRIR